MKVPSFSSKKTSDPEASAAMRDHIRYAPVKVTRSKAFILAHSIYSSTFIRKYALLAIILCLGLGYLFYQRVLYQQYIYQTLPIYQRSIKLKLSKASLEDHTESDRWKPIGDPSARFQIYSAYFDPRLEIVQNFQTSKGVLPFGSIRVFAILPIKVRRRDVFCHFRYGNNNDTFWQRADQVEPVHENFDMHFSAFYVVCKLTGSKHQMEIELPEQVGLSYDDEPSMRNASSFVMIHYPQKHNHGQPTNRQDFLLRMPPSRELAVCVGPAHHNYSNAARVVEFVEYWQLLGAERFYFYNKSITPEVDRVMRHYGDHGMAEILDWNLQGYKFEQELRYEGIFAALNDCLYRSTLVGDFRYTALVDFDEFLIPFGEQQPQQTAKQQQQKAPNAAAAANETLVQYLRRRDRTDSTHSFNFAAVFFYGFYEEDFSRKPTGARNGYLYTQVRMQRTKKPLMHHNRSKYVAVGRRVIEAGNHFVWQALRDTHELRVPDREGLLFHYRDHCIGYGCETFVEDTTARRYEGRIWSSVDAACQRIFPETGGQCPLGQEND